MNQVLISLREDLVARWIAVFPEGKATTSLKQAVRVPKKNAPLYWLDLTMVQPDHWLETVEELSVRGKLVVFSPKPAQSEATLLIRAGAMGYCHQGTPGERLLEISRVLENEGFWMPREMIQRITQNTRRIGSQKYNPEQDPQRLTDRERAVAELIGLGANNAEVAETLNMSERTVKAHLTSIFQQLNLRDRVQLALVMNRLPIRDSQDF
ncbi:MAG: response regulator transcription factor [Pseudomonadales bacterium]|nr:response regulator transcription factor [Pseudomonadales bacterium]